MNIIELWAPKDRNKGHLMASLDSHIIYPNDSLGIKPISPSGFDFNEKGLQQLALAICDQLFREYNYSGDRAAKHYMKMYHSVTSTMHPYIKTNAHFDFKLWGQHLFPENVPTMHGVFLKKNPDDVFGWLYANHPELPQPDMGLDYSGDWIVNTSKGNQRISTKDINFTQNQIKHLFKNKNHEKNYDHTS